MDAVPNQDGSLLVSRLLNEITTVDELADLAGMTPEVRQEEELLNFFGFQATAGALSGGAQGDEETRFQIYHNLSPASETYLTETLTPTNFETLAPAGQSWKFIDRKFMTDKNTGVATFVLLFMKET